MSVQLFSVNLPIAVSMILGLLTRVRRRWKEHPCLVIISYILLHFTISTQHIVEVKQLERHGNHHGELADSSQTRRLIVDLLVFLIHSFDLFCIPLHFCAISSLKILWTFTLIVLPMCQKMCFINVRLIEGSSHFLFVLSEVLVLVIGVTKSTLFVQAIKL